VRDEEDWEVKIKYILNNPVKAGMVKDGLQYEGMYIKSAQTAMSVPLEDKKKF